MKKNIILAYLSITLLSYTSCSKNDEVERLTTEPTMVKTELMTSMPGELLVVEDRLVWLPSGRECGREKDLEFGISRFETGYIE